MQLSVEVRLKVRRFGQTFTTLIIGEVVVANFYRQRANGSSLGPDAGHEIVRHPSQRGLDELLVGLVFVECLLLAVRLGRDTGGHQWTFIDPVGKLPNG